MRLLRVLCLCGFAAAALRAQQFKFNLDHLAVKASNTVDLSLNGATLQFAAKFLDGKDPDEAKVKQLISGLEGIYVKAFEFKTSGAWAQSDLNAVRAQLRAPEWSRIAGVKSDDDGETAELYVRTVGTKVTGIALLATEAREVTVVNIVGPVDLESLAQLGGHFGVPKVEVPRK